MVRGMAHPLALLAQRAGDIRFLRYLGASIGALAVDAGVMFALIGGGVMAPLATALGYSLGIAVHWLLSSRLVFREGVAATGRARTAQKASFVVSAVAGLVLTTLIVSAAQMAGLDLRIAKIAAIGASFVLTYALRAHVVFR